MIIYKKTKEEIQIQINSNIEELNKLKELYENKIIVVKKIETNISDEIQKKENLKERDSFKELLQITQYMLKSLRESIEEIYMNTLELSNLKINIEEYKEDSLKQKIEEYNENYNNIKKRLIENSIIEEKVIYRFIDKNSFQELPKELETEKETQEIEKENKEIIIKNELKDNNTLLISEIQNKVILPYTILELREILNRKEKEYKDLQEVIDKEFTIPLINYKCASISRYREAFTLVREREQLSMFNAFELAFEMLGNNYLHPAIITACKNLDQLDIYLDCLDKNELDDFPFFQIKYELYPVTVKKKK